MRQGIPLVKGQVGWLARAKAHPEGIVDCKTEHSAPLFAGDPAAYIASVVDEHARSKVAEQVRLRFFPLFVFSANFAAA
jgi:hypothetical protein